MPCCWRPPVFRFPLSTPHPLLPAVPAEKRKLKTFTSCRIADTEAFPFQPVGNIGKMNAKLLTRERCTEKQRPYQQEDGRCLSKESGILQSMASVLLLALLLLQVKLTLLFRFLLFLALLFAFGFGFLQLQL